MAFETFDTKVAGTNINGQAGQSGWSSAWIGVANPNATVSTTQFFSSPNSLQIRNNTAARINYSGISGGSLSGTLSFYLYTSAAGSGSNTSEFTLSDASFNGIAAFSLSRTNNHAFVAVLGDGTSGTDMGVFPLSAWTLIELSFTLGSMGATTSNVSARINGGTTFTFSAAANVSTGDVVVQLGRQAGDASFSYVDSITATATPLPPLTTTNNSLYFGVDV